LMERAIVRFIVTEESLPFYQEMSGKAKGPAPSVAKKRGTPGGLITGLPALSAPVV